MAVDEPREGRAPLPPLRLHAMDARAKDVGAGDPSLDLFNVVQDAGQPTRIRESAFSEFLTTPSPLWAGLRPIEWAVAQARAYVGRLVSRDYPGSWTLEPDSIADEALLALGNAAMSLRRAVIASPAAFVRRAIQNQAKWKMTEECSRYGKGRVEFIDDLPELRMSEASDNALQIDWEFVAQAINALSPRLRTVAIMHLLDHMTHPEIAARLGLSQSSVRKRWQRVREALEAKPQ